MNTHLLGAIQSLQSPDNSSRRSAEEYIMDLSRKNFKELLDSLFEILVGLDKTRMIERITSGMVLKMFFVWESAAKKEEVSGRWNALSSPDRESLKRKLMGALEKATGKESEALVQCFSVIARVEMVNKRWPTVFADLAAMVSPFSKPSEHLRRSVIQAAGYLCIDTGDFEQEMIYANSGTLLTLVFGGTLSQDPETQACAFQSLERCLFFIAHNMKIPEECLRIVSAVFSGCTSEHLEVSIRAMECFLSAFQIYPNETLRYISEPMSGVALSFICAGPEKKALLGIDFWGEVAMQGCWKCTELIRKTFPYLMPELIRLTVNEDLESVEEWVPHKAAPWLISHIAQCVPEMVSDSVFQAAGAAGARRAPKHAVRNEAPQGKESVSLVSVVDEMLSSDNLQTFEAALVVLGSLLHAETCASLALLVKRNVYRLYLALKSESSVVLDSALWVFEKLFRHMYHAMDLNNNGGAVVPQILHMIQAREDVAVSASWSLAGIISAVGAQVAADDEIHSVILAGFGEVMKIVLGRFLASKPGEYTLRVALAAAISELVRAASEKEKPAVLQASRDILGRIREELETRSPNEEFVSCSVGVLQVCVSSFPHEVLATAPNIPSVFAWILGQSSLSSLHTDAYLLLGALADGVGVDFGVFSESLSEFVVRDLGSLGGSGEESEGSTFSTSLITFVGSMASAIQLGFVPLTDTVVPLLINAVLFRGLPRDAKVSAVTTFADVALAVGRPFERYLPQMFGITISIITLEDDGSDPGFVLSLREALLDLLSCIVQSSNGKNPTIAENIPVVLETVKRIVSETSDTSCVVKSLYLISDLWVLYGTTKNAAIVRELEAPWVLDFISNKTQSPNRQVKEAAITTRFQINSVSH